MAEDEAARAMFEWANSVPPADLAAELMPAFGPDGPSDGNNLSRYSLFEWLFRGYPTPSRYFRPLRMPMLEAVQLLQHAELIVNTYPPDLGVYTPEQPTWSATRLGLSALASGKAAVRERIKDRTGA